MGIYSWMNRIPGGILVVPLLIGAIINTFFPCLIPSLGGMTQALFSTGTLAFAGLILFATGACLSIKDFASALKRGGVLCAAKLVSAFVFVLLYVRIAGMDGFLGISAVAFAGAMCSSNPGVYISIIDTCGDDADRGNYAFLNIVAMPAIPVLVIGAATNSAFNYLELVTVFLPFVLGFVFGNIDRNLTKVFANTLPLILPFLGFCFGFSLNLVSAFTAGLGGIILSVIFVILNVMVLIPVDKLILKRPGYAGSAMCAAAGICIAVPEMMGVSYSQYAPNAVSQLAMCVIITSFSAPFITKALFKKSTNV